MSFGLAPLHVRHPPKSEVSTAQLRPDRIDERLCILPIPRICNGMTNVVPGFEHRDVRPWLQVGNHPAMVTA